MTIIGTKWVFRNKLDANGIVSRNKARILLVYACALDFKLFQMDVKSAFLNGFINEEIYMAQPPGFIDFKKLDHVYKLKKALYGLKQAPKAWYDRLKAFLIKHEYKMGIVDNTLFTKKKSSNLMIVQIYVDDIIFGSTCQDMCDEFSKIMHDEFKMSMMGELNFFLGLQIKQMEDSIFFNQSKYIKEMLKKFGVEDSKPMKTPMSSDTKLTKDEECGDDEDDGAMADMNNLDTTIQVSPNLTIRIRKDHPFNEVIGYLQSAIQTRNISKNLEEHGFVSTIQQRTNHKDIQNCLFTCFLSRKELKKIIHALKDPRWIKAMQEELLQFMLQEVWTLVDLPNGKKAIGSKEVFRNKKYERGIVIRNKARLVAQGYTQEEGIDYDTFFAPVPRIEAIRLFLAYASFKDFVVYQMDVKSVFLYKKIEEEVYACQPPGFEDLDNPDRVYKVEKALYLSTYMLDNGFQRGKIDKTLFIKRHNGELTFFLGLQVKQKKDGIFISQDKYVEEISKKFRSMIGSLMYLTSSRPDIMFAVCVCARYQVNPKVSHLHAMKRIFRLISWQCKKHIVVVNSTTEAEYVAASSCSDGFEQIVDFLNAYPIRHALTINPTIYISCIEQLWSTVVVKTINEEAQLHALVDGNKIIITKSSVRRDLQLADEEGVECLLNSTIFEQLALIGPKATAWNEFSSIMASAIICLATNQKFNFSKFIFESMIRNLDNMSGKFLMYPRQKPRKPKRKDTHIPQPSDPIEYVADEAVHKELGDSLVRAATTASSLEAEQDSGGGPRCQETIGDTIARTRFKNISKHSNDLLLVRGNTLRSDEDRLKLNELMALCTTLQNRVLDLEKTKTTQHNTI
ncbi:putative ribonuclease H-like domain-containing protein [Tanacetum coccineum]